MLLTLLAAEMARERPPPTVREDTDDFASFILPVPKPSPNQTRRPGLPSQA